MGQVGTIRPEVTDIMDADKFVTQYWERLGVDARTMSSPDEIKGMREMRAQQQAQQQQMQDTQVQADTAKVLSDTKIEQDSALSALVNQTRAFQ
jgi:gamma-glutamyl:cysteine ligase YbdK (ATP-grasp superfamily)